MAELTGRPKTGLFYDNAATTPLRANLSGKRVLDVLHMSAGFSLQRWQMAHPPCGLRSMGLLRPLNLPQPGVPMPHGRTTVFARGRGMRLIFLTAWCRGEECDVVTVPARICPGQARSSRVGVLMNVFARLAARWSREWCLACVRVRAVDLSSSSLHIRAPHWSRRSRSGRAATGFAGRTPSCHTGRTRNTNVTVLSVCRAAAHLMRCASIPTSCVRW